MLLFGAMRAISIALSRVLLALLVALVTLAAATPAAPVIRVRPDGLLDVEPSSGTIVRYTLDGSEPGQDAGVWLAPVDLPPGYTLKARSFAADGTASRRGARSERRGRVGRVPRQLSFRSPRIETGASTIGRNATPPASR